jgi:glucose-1-phosphate cytidylyltransferase
MAMKAVILAGGRGSRLSEETDARPKPLVEIGGRPIIWHIMSIYAHYGLRDFVVCAGYKGFLLKEYFANLALHNADVTVDVASGRVTYHDETPADWTVLVADTGRDTMTAGRVRRVRDYLDPEEPFCLTYGDGLADVDIAATVEFHRAQQRLVTLTAVPPRPRFGVLDLDGDRVTAVHEKRSGQERLINGGFFVVDPAALDRIEGDASIWETDVLARLATEDQLGAFRHDGFWQPMDTLWEKELLEKLWRSDAPPWKVW